MKNAITGAIGRMDFSEGILDGTAQMEALSRLQLAKPDLQSVQPPEAEDHSPPQRESKVFTQPGWGADSTPLLESRHSVYDPKQPPEPLSTFP